MILLYRGSGSSEIECRSDPVPIEAWANLRHSVCQLLRTRQADIAAGLLESIPFDLCEATNSFGDQFHILLLLAPLHLYNQLIDKTKDSAHREAFAQIANTICEVGPYIRFIAMSLDMRAKPEPVATPSLAFTSDTVERALADCEQLIRARGATSGVDRVHTAFHGYLRMVCTQAQLEVSDGSSTTQLFKAMREGHPLFVESGPRGSDINRIIRSMAAIIDSLNPLRNQATLAHPNDAVLEEAEAMLVINAVRTLLHYLNTKLR